MSLISTLMLEGGFLAISKRLYTIWGICNERFGRAPSIEELHCPDTIRFSMPIAETNLKATGAPMVAVRGDGGSAHRAITDGETIKIFGEHPQGLTPKDFVEALPPELLISERRAQERLKKLVSEGSLERDKRGKSFVYRAK